jgi:hypothetical protein
MPYKSPLDLALEAIKRFSPDQLSCPPRAYDGKETIFEDQWQKKFYRCLVPLLDRYVYVFPPLSLVDFQVAGTNEQWAIELVRDSDRLEEHYDRFRPGGAYYSAVARGVIDKFIILNFCTALPEGYSFGIDITHCPTSEYH